MSFLRTLFHLLKRTIVEFIDDNAMTQAASVAFYTSLSFAPLLMIFITIGGMLGDETQNELIKLFESQISPRAADITEAVIEQAEEESEDRPLWRWLLGFAVLTFSASGVFAQLQASMNRVWDIEVRPGRSLWAWLRKRLLSIGMIFAVLFILLVTLVVSSVIDSIVARQGDTMSRVVSTLVTLLVNLVLFGLLLRFVPDVRIPWSDVLIGAVVTATLFTAGKLAISAYIQHGRVGEEYGDAAGSLIALLVWSYYSAVIVFLGAELTQQTARLRGSALVADPHAVLVDDDASPSRE